MNIRMSARSFCTSILPSFVTSISTGPFSFFTCTLLETPLMRISFERVLRLSGPITFEASKSPDSKSSSPSSRVKLMSVRELLKLTVLAMRASFTPSLKSPSSRTVPLTSSRETSLARFFLNETATTEIYTLSLHDALPIFQRAEDTALLVQHHMGAERHGLVLLDLLLPERSEEHTSELQSRRDLVCRL